MITQIGTNMIETERLTLRRFEYTDDDAMRPKRLKQLSDMDLKK